MANKNNPNVIQEDDDEDTEHLVPDVIAEDVRDLEENKKSPLRRVAESFKFPLKDEDYKDLAMLGLRFDSMEEAVGLSLPQLGINRRAIMFQVKVQATDPDAEPEPPIREDPEEFENPLEPIDLKKEMLEKDPNVIWPKTLWINPTYTIPRDALLDEEYESCYSLTCDDEFVIGPVFRLDRINYRAYDSQGRIYEGQAEGYVARIIQHEIDHLDGKLYIDYVAQERVLRLPDYGDKYGAGQLPELQKGVRPEFGN